jgi:hypothetical protein
MSLHNLTTSGWIWFALTVVVDATFLTQLIMATRFKDRDFGIWPWLPALITVYLLWLMTP